jgi:predicted NAD-dependent protein-ADP-ribosyltransferase YbiA (DUF1768 family)
MDVSMQNELDYTSSEFIKSIPSIVQTMYNNNIVFMFYSNSKDEIPGKGIREKIIMEEENKYIPLLRTNWRKKLSNFWVQPFNLDNKRWASVEHYYQASKFKKENADFYYLFSIDSDSIICKDPGMAKSAGGKSGKVQKKKYRPKNVNIDSDFFSTNRNNEEMYKAQFAKFTQNDDLKKILISTIDAKLMHIICRSQTSIFFDNLVVIRNLIKTGKV